MNKILQLANVGILLCLFSTQVEATDEYYFNLFFSSYHQRHNQNNLDEQLDNIELGHFSKFKKLLPKLEAEELLTNSGVNLLGSSMFYERKDIFGRTRTGKT